MSIIEWDKRIGVPDFEGWEEREKDEECITCGGSGLVEGEHYDDLQPCRNC